MPTMIYYKQCSGITQIVHLLNHQTVVELEKVASLVSGSWVRVRFVLMAFLSATLIVGLWPLDAITRLDVLPQNLAHPINYFVGKKLCTVTVGNYGLAFLWSF